MTTTDDADRRASALEYAADLSTRQRDSFMHKAALLGQRCDCDNPRHEHHAGTDTCQLRPAISVRMTTHSGGVQQARGGFLWCDACIQAASTRPVDQRARRAAKTRAQNRHNGAAAGSGVAAIFNVSSR